MRGTNVETASYQRCEHPGFSGAIHEVQYMRGIGGGGFKVGGGGFKVGGGGFKEEVDSRLEEEVDSKLEGGDKRLEGVDSRLEGVFWSSEDAQGPQHQLQTANRGVQYVKGGYMVCRMITGYQRQWQLEPVFSNVTKKDFPNTSTPNRRSVVSLAVDPTAVLRPRELQTRDAELAGTRSVGMWCGE
eukprot:1194120-Prorocentrum_minimum.AAC.4